MCNIYVSNLCLYANCLINLYKPNQFSFDYCTCMSKHKIIFMHSCCDLFSPLFSGVRQCPGNVYTRNHMYLIVANLIHQFNITFPSGAAPKPSLEPQQKSSTCFLFCEKYKVVFMPRHWYVSHAPAIFTFDMGEMVISGYACWYWFCHHYLVSPMWSL